MNKDLSVLIAAKKITTITVMRPDSEGTTSFLPLPVWDAYTMREGDNLYVIIETPDEPFIVNNASAEITALNQNNTVWVKFANEGEEVLIGW